MKLAEALAERSDIQARLEQLKARATQTVRIQEGDSPDEDPRALINEAERLHTRLGELITRINATNASAPFDETRTISDAITARDIASRRRTFFAQLADAAAARHDRFTRSEVKYVAAYPVAELRAQADAAAKEYRELDTRLQECNWTTELR
ncbi:DIP1984 family protein [Agrococcus casei]|uniref:DIP1984 family protein n=1 Tax=Agrococcus casei TaxID=343512 RepID=UPI003F8DDFAA